VGTRTPKNNKFRKTFSGATLAGFARIFSFLTCIVPVAQKEAFFAKMVKNGVDTRLMMRLDEPQICGSQEQTE
jgi:hypothetical protein